MLPLHCFFSLGSGFKFIGLYLIQLYPIRSIDYSALLSSKWEFFVSVLVMLFFVSARHALAKWLFCRYGVLFFLSSIRLGFQFGASQYLCFFHVFVFIVLHRCNGKRKIKGIFHSYSTFVGFFILRKITLR